MVDILKGLRQLISLGTAWMTTGGSLWLGLNLADRPFREEVPPPPPPPEEEVPPPPPPPPPEEEEVVPAPLASFVADPGSGAAPLTVQFTDKSTGDITSWEWIFGDGETSTERNPRHTYDRMGDYQARLVVGGPGGLSTAITTISVKLEEIGPPTPPVIISPISPFRMSSAFGGR